MQILTIVVQSTVPYQDLGVATSGVTFFRTLGSSFGAAVFGAIYANVLSDQLPAAIAARRGGPGRRQRAPRRCTPIRTPPIAPIVDAYADAMHVVFLAAVPVALLAFVVALFLKQVPLRGTARETAQDVGEGFGVPDNADADQQLQAAIARLVQHKGGTELPVVRQQSGSAFGNADGWTVGQVYLRARLGRPTSLGEIARRYRVPAEVLEPAFAQSAARGYLVSQDGHFDLTPTGREEVGKLIAAFRAWLADELADWGPDDPGLDRALGDLATKFVNQDPQQLAGPVGLFATVG